jgi:hypothetical protein
LFVSDDLLSFKISSLTLLFNNSNSFCAMDNESFKLSKRIKSCGFGVAEGLIVAIAEADGVAIGVAVGTKVGVLVGVLFLSSSAIAGVKTESNNEIDNTTGMSFFFINNYLSFKFMNVFENSSFKK